MTDRPVVYEFGELRLDPVARVFTRRGQPIALAPKSFDLLMLLVDRRGRVLERGELIKELWPDTIVEEANVTFQISIWRIPVEGGDEELVVEEYGSGGSWDLTAEGLYFVVRESSSSGTSWVVRFHSFARRHATEVARLRHPPFLGGPAISVSSDGRWMLSTQVQEESDLLLVEKPR